MLDVKVARTNILKCDHLHCCNTLGNVVVPAIALYGHA
jgi:hypothetical protein